MADLAAFRAALPMFAAVGDATVQIYMDMAGRQVGDNFGDRSDDAHIFLSAHLLSMAGIGPGSQANALAGFTNIRAGSLSLTRADRAAAGDYASSPYGILFWQIKRGVGGSIGFGVTGTGVVETDDTLFYAPPHGED